MEFLHTPTVQVAAPPFPLVEAAGIVTPVAFDMQVELSKMWRNIQRNQANATAQIKVTLDPIVARVD